MSFSFRALVFCCLLPACSSSPPLVEGPEAAGEPTEPAEPAEAPDTPPAEPTLEEDRIELPSSSITPWLEPLAELALAALRGQPLPDAGIALAPDARTGPMVEQGELVPTPVPFLRITGAVVSEVDMTLEGVPDLSRLQISLALTQEGLRIAVVERRDNPRGGAVLPADHPVHLTALEVIEELREGRSGPLLLTTEGCRGLLGNSSECERIPVQTDDSIDEVLEGLRVDLTTARGPTAYRFDDVILVARGPSDEIYGVILGLDCENGQLQIRGTPLVEVILAPR